jgi:hypothetical protein
MHVRQSLSIEPRFDPAVVGELAGAYESALDEIMDACCYLPSRDCRRAIASGMILEARSGEHDPERLKISGLACIGDVEAIPLGLAFAALLRHAARTAAWELSQGRKAKQTDPGAGMPRAA